MRIGGDWLGLVRTPAVELKGSSRWGLVEPRLSNWWSQWRWSHAGKDAWDSWEILESLWPTWFVLKSCSRWHHTHGDNFPISSYFSKTEITNQGEGKLLGLTTKQKEAMMNKRKMINQWKPHNQLLFELHSLCKNRPWSCSFFSLGGYKSVGLFRADLFRFSKCRGLAFPSQSQIGHLGSTTEWFHENKIGFGLILKSTD